MMRIRTVIFLIIAALVAGCDTPTRHQRGGGASVSTRQSDSISKPTLPSNINIVGNPNLAMGLDQPENPEGTSSMSSKQTTTTVYPDGTVVVDNLETATEIGGSQDYAKILKEYSQSDYFKGLLAGVGMIFGAWWMYKKEWDMVAAILFIGGIFCIFWSWMAAPVGVGAAVLVAGGHYKTLAAKIIT